MIPLALAILFASSALAQTIVSAASASAGLAPGSLASIYADHLAPVEEAVEITPWPATLGGVKVQITDSAMQTRSAGLLFVSPSQINLQIPQGTATGPATISVSGAAHLLLHAEIHPVAPALFTVDDTGIAAARAVLVVMPSLVKSPVPVYDCSGHLSSSCALTPIPHHIDTVVYVSLYATGFGFQASLARDFVNIGDQSVSPTYVGPDDSHPGRDRIDFPLPDSLHGKLSVTVTIDGVTSNPARILVQ